MVLIRSSRFLAISLCLAMAAPAAQRSLELLTPAQVAAGATATVLVRAATDAGAAEQIGFLHLEMSIDHGNNWVPLAYEHSLGATFERRWSVTVGGPGTRTLLRVRAAFRGGVAGDVDFTGAAIRWKDSWAAWGSPPARHAVILVGS